MAFPQISLANSLTTSDDVGLVFIGSIVGNEGLESVALVQSKKSGKIVAVKRKFRVLGRYLVGEIFRDHIILFDGETKIKVYKSKFDGYKKGHGSGSK